MNENKCQIVLIRNTENCKKGFLNVVLKKKTEFDGEENKKNLTKIKPLNYFEEDFIDWNFDKSFINQV